jgi:hypothetical protein
MGDDGHHDTIAQQVIGVVVATRELIGLGQAHQSSGLSRRDQASADLRSVDNHDRLSTGPTRRRPQATCNTIEPDLGSLDAVACSPID